MRNKMAKKHSFWGCLAGFPQIRGKPMGLAIPLSAFLFSQQHSKFFGHFCPKLTFIKK
jgi:hypothetical protein